VVALAGITSEELARYKAPAKFLRPAAPIPQPPESAPGPRMTYPPAVYALMLATSDAELLARASETEPPVRPR
jgi:hypothetical protein